MVKTWRGPDAQPGSYAFGMLGLEERKLLYHLARDFYTGAGAVIDAGAFCGASACALAAGLRDNPGAQAWRDRRVLHAYDLFIANHPYLIDSIEAGFGRKLRLGESFLPLFEDAVREFSSLIEIHPGDLRRATWDENAPIEILFIDAAKNLLLSDRIMQLFLPSLIPGKSFVIHQDFYHPGTFFLVVVMDFLREHFSIMEPRRDFSAAFRFESPIPRWKLWKAGKYAFSPQAQLEAIRRTIDALDLVDRPYLELSYAVALGALERREHFDAHFEATLRRFGHLDDPVWTGGVDYCRSFDERRFRAGPLIQEPTE